MALSFICGFWIVLVLLPGTLSLGCEELHVHIEKTNCKLNEMGGRLSRHCVTRRGAGHIQSLNLITLSDNLTDEGKMLLLHQTLDEINKTFSGNLSTAPWDAVLLESFRAQLSQQLQHLSQCVREPVSESKSVEIEEYFRKLRQRLELEKFSECAWRIVRSQTRARLQQIQTIIGKMKQHT